MTPPSAKADPEVSVVIPTCDRPQLLARTLASVLAQRTNLPYEVLVVNDGRPLPRLSELEEDRVRVIDAGTRRGPARARNLGVEHASGEVILFTDDDALPDPDWLDAAAAALDANPDAVGVEGPIEGCDFDPLYEHSIHNEIPGAYYTCNIAYRRTDFLAVGGFDIGFLDPHCEDVDLGRRLAARGAILFAPSMRVVHLPRPIGFWDQARRARLIESEWRLFVRHPETRPPRWSVRWGPWIRIARRWQRRLVGESSIVRGSGRRAARLLALAAAQLAIGLHTSVTRWPPHENGEARETGSNRA